MGIAPMMGIGFLFLLIIGVPIGFAMGAISVFIFYQMGMEPLFSMVPQRFFAGWICLL